jgi:hypothetical protein
MRFSWKTLGLGRARQLLEITYSSPGSNKGTLRPGPFRF